MNIFNEMQRIFCEVFDDDSIVISREMEAKDIEDWDSLTHMQLIIEIEKRFNIKFTTREIINSKNVGEFMDMIADKLNEE